jgi:hypothetical protein
MNWNYRVLMNQFGELAIHEVYYNSKGVPNSCTATPVIVCAENISEILEQLERMKNACTKPVIDEQYFIKLEPEDKDADQPVGESDQSSING